jgi:hypothetical protein
VAAGAAGAYYGANYYGGGSPYYNSGYNNLYGYAGGATAPAANATPATNTAPATNSAAANTTSTTARSANEGGMGYNVQASAPFDTPALYAACQDRTFGACPTTQ